MFKLPLPRELRELLSVIRMSGIPCQLNCSLKNCMKAVDVVAFS